MLKESFHSLLEKLRATHEPNLTALKKRTVSPLIFLPIAIVGAGIPIAFVLILLPHRLDVALPALVIIALALFVPEFLMISKRSAAYHKYFKTKVVPHFAKLVHENIEYNPLDPRHTKLSLLELYNRAEYSDIQPNKVSIKDCFSFTSEDSHYELHSLHLMFKIKAGEQTHVTQIFRGLFAHATLATDLECNVQIVLQDPQAETFQEAFALESNDEFTAAAFLTESTKTALLDFAHAFPKSKLDIFITGDDLLLRIHSFPHLTLPLSQASLPHTDAKPNVFYLHYCTLSLLAELTKPIELDQESTIQSEFERLI